METFMELQEVGFPILSLFRGNNRQVLPHGEPSLKVILCCKCLNPGLSFLQGCNLPVCLVGFWGIFGI